MTVYFHGSFGLNREYMAGVLATSLKNPNASGDEIAAPFGYKAPFTGRYKSWLHKTGLTTKGHKINLTPIGEVVWEHDPKFKSLVTRWLMHHELCTDSDRAEAWHRQEVKPGLGKWCEGYITIRGTWCEPLSVGLVNRLNQRLAEVARAVSR